MTVLHPSVYSRDGRYRNFPLSVIAWLNTTITAIIAVPIAELRKEVSALLQCTVCWCNKILHLYRKHTRANSRHYPRLLPSMHDYWNVKNDSDMIIADLNSHDFVDYQNNCPSLIYSHSVEHLEIVSEQWTRDTADYIICSYVHNISLLFFFSC